MVLPLKSWFTVFDTIILTTTARIPALGAEHPEHANSIILEIVGASTPSWTLDIQGRTDPGGTYTAIDYVQIWQAGAAALANAQLSITDATRRFYLIPNVPSFVQLVATFTTGSLTVRGSYTSEVFSQWLLTTARGSIFAEGPVAHDAVVAGNPLLLGGEARADPEAETNVAAGDIARLKVDLDGLLWAKMLGGSTLTDGASATAPGVFQGGGGMTVRPLGVMTFALAPDASSDRQRSLGDTAGAGLGVFAAAPWIPGASAVTSTVVDVATTSATRQTLITPTSGKRVRITSVEVVSRGLTTNPDRVGVYFGTGTAYTTTAANAIAEFVPGTTGEQSFIWGDGAGPVGAVDAVVSGITETETETNLRYTIHYREE